MPVALLVVAQWHGVTAALLSISIAFGAMTVVAAAAACVAVAVPRAVGPAAYTIDLIEYVLMDLAVTPFYCSRFIAVLLLHILGTSLALPLSSLQFRISPLLICWCVRRCCVQALCSARAHRA